MSLACNNNNVTSSSEDSDIYSYSSSDSSEEANNPWQLSSTLLSHPKNQISSSSSEEATTTGTTSKLSCPTGLVSSSDGEEEGSSGSESDEFDELYATSSKLAAAAAVAVATTTGAVVQPLPTMNKVVHLSALRPLAAATKSVEMGTLAPISTTTASVNTKNTLTPLSAMSSEQLEALTLHQEKRKNTAMNKLTPLSTMSGEQLEALLLKQQQEKRGTSKLTPLSTLNNKQLDALLVQQEKRKNDGVAVVATPTSNKLTLLASLSSNELDKVIKKQEERSSFFKQSDSEIKQLKATQAQRLSALQPISAKTGKLTPLSALTTEQFNEVARKQQALRSGTTTKKAAYKLEKISELSAEKRDELFIQQRKRLMSHIKPLAECSPQELSALRNFGCPMNLTPVDDLSIEQLRELVTECRQKHAAKEDEQVIVLTTTNTTQILPVDTRRSGATQAQVSKQQTGVFLTTTSAAVSPNASQVLAADSRRTGPTQAQVSKKETGVFLTTGAASASAATTKRPDIVLKSVGNPLVNFHTLSTEKQNEIRQVMAAKKTFTNSKSSLSAKKEFDAKLGNSILSNKNIQTLYHGLSASTHLDCPLKPSSGQEIAVMEHIKRHHPVYADLLKKHVDRRVLETLVDSKEGRNYFLVVPSDALLALYRQQGELLRIAKLATAYLAILLKRGETIPADNKYYSCANLLENDRVMVRRVDDQTLVIDNEITARLDPGSGGRVYKMVEQGQVPVVVPTPVVVDPRRTLVSEIAEEVADEIEIREQARREVLEEERLEEEEEEEEEELEEEELAEEEMMEEEIVVRRNERQEPRVIVILPEESANSLTIVPVREREARGLTQLAGVYRNSLYKNRKLEALATKMLSADYSGAKHMANFIDHAATSAASKEPEQLLLRTFAYDELYDKYLNTSLAVTSPERLSVAESITINTNGASLNYALDAATKMKEFTVDTKTTKIAKSQLINHFAVLCLKTKKDSNEYATLSFSLPDETKSLTDTYMSTDENILLKFKDNILQSIVLNTDACLLATKVAEPEKTSLLTGKATEVTQLISVQVPMASVKDAERLYAKDLNFAQFLGVVMPLSQMSLIERAKAALAEYKNVKVMPLRRIVGPQLESHNKELNAYEEVREITDSIQMGIGRGAFETATAFRMHAYHRVMLRNPERRTQFMVRYDYDPALNKNVEPVSFHDMVNFKNVTERPTLSIRLLDPMVRKRKLFRFQLAIARGASLYEARSADGLHFDFRVEQSGLISQIYIRYLHQDRKHQTLPLFDKDIAQFLANEAYAYKRLNLNLVSSYMSHRLNKFVVSSDLPREKLDTQQHTEFFANLHKEIDAYIKKEGLETLLKDAPDTKLTSEKAAILENSGYKVLRPEETKQFQSLMLSGFALGQALPLTLSATNATETRAKNVLNAVISEYTTLSGQATATKDVEFALYMNRFKHIANCMVFVFNSKK